jgi:antitoxin component of RelBE/YafQ-DinJ toxin-antitoxin module
MSTNQAGGSMKTQVWFQVRADEEIKKKAKKVAEYRGIDMSSLIRAQIQAAYSRLPEAAK